MLDAFFSVVYNNDLKHSEGLKLAQVLSTLPEEDLFKLASGKAKLAFGECSESSDNSWLSKYKGSPLFDKALALERAELEVEIADLSHRTQDQARYELCRTRDQIRLQKKMLDLELMAEQNGMLNGPVQPMSVIPSNEVQDNEVQVSDAPIDTGTDVPPQQQKQANAASDFARSALRFAKKNPHLVGSGVGAVGGAIAGGPEHRLSGALGGAALGAGAGHAAKGISMRMTGPKAKGFVDASKGYGRSVADRVRGVFTKPENPMQYSIMRKPAPPASAPVQEHARHVLDLLDERHGRVLVPSAVKPAGSGPVVFAQGRNYVQQIPVMKAASARFTKALRALEA